MRQRPSFRATAWESLEGRELLSTIPAATAAPQPVRFPDFGVYLQKLDKQHAAASKPSGAPGASATGSNPKGNPQAQVLVAPSVTPYGFLDGRVTLTRFDVAKLNAAVNAFASGYTAGQDTAADAAATATFRSNLTALDQFIAGEQKVTGGTTNFISPLLTGSAPTRGEVDGLRSAVHDFSSTYTYGYNPGQDTVALNSLESSLNLLLTDHHRVAVKG